MPTETVYEHCFSSIEKMIDYIIDSCCLDCYCCMWPKSIPCYWEFSMICTKEDIEKWLLSEYKDEGKQ